MLKAYCPNISIGAWAPPLDRKLMIDLRSVQFNNSLWPPSPFANEKIFQVFKILDIVLTNKKFQIICERIHYIVMCLNWKCYVHFLKPLLLLLKKWQSLKSLFLGMSVSTLRLKFEYRPLRKQYFDFFSLIFMHWHSEKNIFLILALLYAMKLLAPEGMNIATLTLITNRTRQEELKNA